MKRFQFDPPTSLQTDVKFLWTLEEPIDTYNRDSIIPDSYIELIINCGAPLYLEDDAGRRIDMPRVFLNGLQRKPLRLRTTGLCQFVAMRLYPWAVRSVLGMDASQSALAITPLDGVWHDLARTVTAAVHHRGYAEGVFKLQQFVVDMNNRKPHDLNTIRGAVQHLYLTAGQVRMDELAMNTALSPSQFERRFKYLTGVTPKLMARLIRFENICTAMFCNPIQRTTDLAHEFGFTDQAHFIHDFKNFTQVTPTEFVNTSGIQWREWREWREWWLKHQNAEILQSA